MTELLKQTMVEKADRLDPAGPDLDAILDRGRGRVRTRRLGFGAAGLVAAATAAAIVVPLAVGAGSGDGRRADSAEVAANEAPGLSWAEGSTIHTPDGAVEVGVDVHAYVASDRGFLVVGPDRAVWSWADGTATEVGRVPDDLWEQLVFADGDVVAWLDDSGATQQFVAIDQRTGRRTAVEMEPVDPDLQLPDGSLAADGVGVRALDAGTVYAMDARGVFAIDAASGDVEVLAPLSSGVMVDDVEDGLVLFSTSVQDRVVDGEVLDGSEATYLTTDLANPGDPIPLRGGDIAPGGGYVMSENSAEDSDDFTVVEVATGAVSEPAAKAAYGFFTGISWLDAETYLAVGMDRVPGSDTWTAELLVCTVDGACDVAEDLSTELDLGDVQLPLGIHLGS